MRKLFISLCLITLSAFTFAKEITLKCDYFTHSGNEKTYGDYSDNPFINSRCDEQKLERNAKLLRQKESSTFDEGICKTNKIKYVSFNESMNQIKVLEGSSWKTYSNVNAKRRCLDETLCRVKTQRVLIDDEKIVLNIRDRFQLKSCQFPLPELEAFMGTEYEKYQELLGQDLYNAYLKGCYAFDLSGTFQTDQDSFTIDRKTGEYSEVTKRGKTTYDKKTKNLKGLTIRGSLTKETLWAQYIDETGTCSLVSTGKKF